MEDATLLFLYISIAADLVAVGLAIRLIPLTGRPVAWGGVILFYLALPLHKALEAHGAVSSLWTIQVLEFLTSLAVVLGLVLARGILLEQRAGRRRLEAVHRQWVDTFDAIDDPIFIHDAQARLIRVNRAYAKAAGREISAVLGRPYWSIFPRGGPLPSQALLAAGESVVEERLTLENGCVYQLRGFRLGREEPEQPAYFIYILHDVTERHRMELERRILAEAVRQAGEGIILLNTDLTFRYANPGFSELVGFPAENLAGTPLDRFLPQQEGRPLLAIREAVERKGVWRGEVGVRAMDGETIPVHLSAATIRGSDGQTEAYVGIYDDLRETKREQQRTEALRHIIEELSTESDLDRLGYKAVADAVQVTGANFGAVALRDEPEGLLRYRWHWGISAADTGPLTTPLGPGQGMAGEVVQQGRARRVDDYACYPRPVPALRHYGVQSALSVPIWQSGEVVGALSVADTRQVGRFDDSQIPLLESIARQIGVAMERSRLLEELRVSERFTATILDTAPVLILVLDRDGRIIRFNRACQELTGHDIGRARGEHFWNLFPPGEEAAYFRERFSLLASGRKPPEEVVPWVARGGCAASHRLHQCGDPRRGGGGAVCDHHRRRCHREDAGGGSDAGVTGAEPPPHPADVQPPGEGARGAGARTARRTGAVAHRHPGRSAGDPQQYRR